MGNESAIVELVERAHRGEPAAVEEIIQRNREWLWSYVRRHMGERLRRFEASEDVVQDVLRKLLQRGPSFVPRNEDDFRRLVATIVLNRLCDRHDWARAARRDPAREEGGGDAPTHIGMQAPSVDRPSQVAVRNEEHALVQLAMELVDPDDALVIRMRNWEEQPFERIGEELGVESDAARMRFNRALRRLGEMMRRLERGELDALAPDHAPHG